METHNPAWAPAAEPAPPVLAVQTSAPTSDGRIFFEDPDAQAVIESGAGDGSAVRRNERAWREITIVPRVLADVRQVSTATELLGRAVSTPVLMAPTAAISIIDVAAEAELLPRLAAAGTFAALGDNRIRPEEVTASGAPHLRQIYVDVAYRSTLGPLLDSLPDAGAIAVAVTVDHASSIPDFEFRKHYRDLYLTQRLSKEPGFVPTPPELVGGVTPEILSWIVEASALPVVVKGVLHPDDARIAAQVGAAAVVVSNHGGRQIEGSIASAAALPEVVRAVGDDIEVWVDSGIRSGEDVFRAVALGARGVLVGRPVLRALATDGVDGVLAELDRLTAELRSTMALSGTDRIGAIGADHVRLP